MMIIFFRMSRFLYSTCKNWYYDQGEDHYFWYYDTLYPDHIYDPEDNRYINFAYSDSPVQPEQLTAYYPYDHLKYHTFLEQKQTHLGNPEL